MNKLKHVSVLLEEFLHFAPEFEQGQYLDVTAGGGGHLSEFLLKKPGWGAEAWDRDPLAEERVHQTLRAKNLPEKRVDFVQKCFSEASQDRFHYILADLGISSFQIDDPNRGMSFHSESPIDFRMNPDSGPSFKEWFDGQSEGGLTDILELYGEEKKAAKLASKMKAWDIGQIPSAKAFAAKIAEEFPYSSESKKHPATRVFQALRIAINDEMGELRKFLDWAPECLEPGGRLALISFHSLEDRFVKRKFNLLAKTKDFRLLTKKPVFPSAEEENYNPRARSAKLRVIERLG